MLAIQEETVTPWCHKPVLTLNKYVPGVLLCMQMHKIMLYPRDKTCHNTSCNSIYSECLKFVIAFC